jgi:menaquinone-dependent protoporphyrinogen oxidase
MEILVAYASRTGFTKGIAEFIGERLRSKGPVVDVQNVNSVKDVSRYDAFVIGSAVYMFHWEKDAKKFLSKNRVVLSTRPVWLFSSGPVGTSKTNDKGRDLLDVTVSGPKEIEELQKAVKPRDHKVFFGGLDGSKLTGATGFMYRMVRKSESARESMPEGDFRDWNEIGAWAEGIAAAVQMVPAS